MYKRMQIRPKNPHAASKINLVPKCDQGRYWLIACQIPSAYERIFSLGADFFCTDFPLKVIEIYKEWERKQEQAKKAPAKQFSQLDSFKQLSVCTDVSDTVSTLSSSTYTNSPYFKM